MMEIARVFSAGAKPRWSVLFAAWAGEEEGLYGSYAYVNHPYFPLATTIAYLNLDMVGNGEPLLFESAETHTALRAVTTESAKQLGITISVQGYTGDSDHAPFEEKGVPNFMFIYWPYEEYHTPSDTPDRVSRANLLVTAKLTALIALKLSEATVTSITSSVITVTAGTTAIASSVHATTVATNTVSGASTLVTIEASIIAGVVLVVVCAIGVYYLKRRRD
jgi:Zn-dependent M28 family amino/carboxypeptidase